MSEKAMVFLLAMLKCLILKGIAPQNSAKSYLR